MNNLGSKRSLVMKFGQFMQYYKIIFLLKNSSKNVAWKLVQVLSNFQRILCKKDSVEVSMLLRSYASFFAKTKGPETSFLAVVFVKFFDEIFSFVI